MKTAKIRVLAFLISLLTVTALTSCGDGKKTLSFFAMDTLMNVTVYGDKGDELAEGVRKVIEDAEADYSVTVSGSEVFRLNSGETVSDPSEGLKVMLGLADKMNSITAGAYDITIAPVLGLYGFRSGNYRVPGEGELAEVLARIGADRVTVAPDGSVSLEEGTEIDLGSCVKGYAGDLAVRYLRESGVACAVLSLGGSVHTIGRKPDGSDFRVGIADPASPTDTFANLDVGECAVVTSGVYQRYFEQDGVRYHHLMDARTGRPSESDLVSVTVIVNYADSSECGAGVLADFLSTAMFLLGSEGCAEYYRSQGGFEAVMVCEDGTVYVTPGISENFSLADGKNYNLRITE